MDVGDCPQKILILFYNFKFRGTGVYEKFCPESPEYFIF